MEMIDLSKSEFSAQSKEDKATFLMCSKCECLRKIDYENCKIYCSKPKCKKRSEKN